MDSTATVESIPKISSVNSAVTIAAY